MQKIIKKVEWITIIVIFTLLACAPQKVNKKLWLTHQINNDYGRVCDTHLKPDPLKEKFIDKEIDINTHNGEPKLLKIKFVVPSNEMLRARPTLDKNLNACELYLNEGSIGWLFVDASGCVEYAEINTANWTDWFEAKDIGASLNEIYFNSTGKNPSSLGREIKKEKKERKPLFSYESDYLWGTTISDIVRISLRTDVKKAFELVRFGAPPYNNIVNGEGQIKFLGNKKLKLQFVLKDDPFLKAKLVKHQIYAKNGSYKPKAFDAMTILITGYKGNRVEIISNVILDKILWDTETGKWLDPDQYIPRIAFALAHQIYGPIHEYARKSKDDLKEKKKKRELIREDVRAIKEGMAFIRRIIKSDEFSSLSEGMQKEFKKLLANEKKNFKSWTYMMKAQRRLQREKSLGSS